MQKVNDIREYKRSLREKYRARRIAVSGDERKRADSNILSRLTGLSQYKDAKLLLTYVSVNDEADTYELINRALSDGKKVAVPRCVPNTRLMEFYYINSTNELKAGAFGVPEPNPETEELVEDFSDSICIIPGICFDKSGYRLGYGKGYYDRFLCNYKGSTVGICYSSCVEYKLIHGRYDQKADVVVTEKYINRTYI